MALLSRRIALIKNRFCPMVCLACGKFCFFDQDLGEIAGLPRLMDVGHCNDAYSAIQSVIAPASTFDVDVNQLIMLRVNRGLTELNGHWTHRSGRR